MATRPSAPKKAAARPATPRVRRTAAPTPTPPAPTVAEIAAALAPEVATALNAAVAPLTVAVRAIPAPPAQVPPRHGMLYGGIAVLGILLIVGFGMLYLKPTPVQTMDLAPVTTRLDTLAKAPSVAGSISPELTKAVAEDLPLVLKGLLAGVEDLKNRIPPVATAVAPPLVTTPVPTAPASTPVATPLPAAPVATPTPPPVVTATEPSTLSASAVQAPPRALARTETDPHSCPVKIIFAGQGGVQHYGCFSDEFDFAQPATVEKRFSTGVYRITVYPKDGSVPALTSGCSAYLDHDFEARVAKGCVYARLGS